MVKVERSMPAPASLAVESKKPNGTYRSKDVILQLEKDFNGKCYLCEAPVFDPEIEHRLPHENGKYHDRKFDWWNLFFCCRHCNSVKNVGKYSEGIIDCCRRDPEEDLLFYVTEKEVVVEVRDESDREAVLTAELTEEVYNKRNTGGRIVASQRRFEELTKRMNNLYTQLLILEDDPENRIARRAVRGMLNRREIFAGFTRSYVRSKSGYRWLMEYAANA